jgi:hypothetical protein
MNYELRPQIRNISLSYRLLEVIIGEAAILLVHFY